MAYSRLIDSILSKAYCEDYHGVRRGTRTKQCETLMEMAVNLRNDLAMRKRVGSVPDDVYNWFKTHWDSDVLRRRMQEVFERDKEAYSKMGKIDVKKQSAENYQKKKMEGKAPSDVQIKWLRKYGKEIPKTMAEASAMLDICFGKNKA